MRARSSSSKNNQINIKAKKIQIYNTNLTSTNLNMSISMNLQDKAKQKNNNFIEANKQNLYNFFKDRIPKDKIRLQTKQNIMSPTKIFQLRKQQIQKQKETSKFLMDDSCEIEPLFQMPSTQKMNKTFHANSKTKELNNNSMNNSKWIKLGGSTSSYQTPTSSSLGKRSQLTKKKAYISVFGEKNLQFRPRFRQIQSIGSLTIIENENNKSIQKQKQKIRPRTNLKSGNEQQRAKLNSLILKIQNFSKQINPYYYIPQQSSKILQKQHEFEYKKQLQKGQLIEWIKQISNNYKKKNQQLNIHRMKTVEDIQKIDPDFYYKMKNHKNSRLLVRNRALDNIKFQDQKKYNSFVINKSPRLQQDSWMDNLITITDRNKNSIQYVQSFRQNQQIVYNKLQVLSIKQKLQKFGKNLIQSTKKASLFSVKLYNVFLVFWKKRKPYQLQGSYGFFKYIKAGDLEKVQNFVIKNIQYAFQIDTKQRTSLIYAVQNGYINIVKFLITIGLNMDAQNIYGYTALYYALLKNNYQIVQCLLQAGASPWSNQFYTVGKLIQSCSQHIKIIIKNARKIHIARNLIRRITRKQSFWAVNKNKIQGKYVISFS